MNSANSSDYKILIAPLISEKSALNAAVCFEVDKRASKGRIKVAVENVFNVKVESIRTLNVLGKPKKKGNVQGRRASYKKAYVNLKEGYKIDIIEGV